MEDIDASDMQKPGRTTKFALEKGVKFSIRPYIQPTKMLVGLALEFLYRRFVRDIVRDGQGYLPTYLFAPGTEGLPFMPQLLH